MFEVNWIVDRMHVGTTRLQLLVEFKKRMSKSHVNYKAPLRGKILRHALSRHRKNVGVYTDVVTGRF